MRLFVNKSIIIVCYVIFSNICKCYYISYLNLGFGWDVLSKRFCLMLIKLNNKNKVKILKKSNAEI